MTDRQETMHKICELLGIDENQVLSVRVDTTRWSTVTTLEISVRGEVVVIEHEELHVAGYRVTELRNHPG